MSEEKSNVNKSIAEGVGLSNAITFCFDTTGSMARAIADVRARMKSMAEEFFKDIPGLKMGVIAHGDYCDGPLAVSVLELSDDLDKIMSFIQNTPNTSGGDFPECYELALNRANQLAWPEDGGTLVLIGDAAPHEPYETCNKEKLDWRIELAALAAKKVKVIPVQCLNAGLKANAFWSSVAELSESNVIQLQDFADATGMLTAAVYATAGEEMLELYASKSRGTVHDTAAVNMCVDNLRGYSQRRTKMSIDKTVLDENE